VSKINNGEHGNFIGEPIDLFGSLHNRINM